MPYSAMDRAAARREAEARGLILPTTFYQKTPFQELARQPGHGSSWFVEHAFLWGHGREFKPVQRRMMDEQDLTPHSIQYGPRGATKSTMIAWNAIKAFLTNDGWRTWAFVIVSATTDQSNQLLWEKIREWAGRINWSFINQGLKPGDPRYRPRFSAEELMLTMMRGKTGIAVTRASGAASGGNDLSRSASIEGFHADYMEFDIDEAKETPESLIGSILGSFTQVGLRGNEGHIRVKTAAGLATGWAYRACRRDPDTGYGERGPDWTIIECSIEELIRDQLVHPDQEKLYLVYGKDSAYYQTQWLGKWSTVSDEGSLISYESARRAMDAWSAQRDEHGEDTYDWGPKHYIAIDVADEGKDRTVIAHRHGIHVPYLDVYPQMRTTELERIICAILDEHPDCRAIVDKGGVGTHLYNSLDEKYPGRVIPFVTQERSRAIAMAKVGSGYLPGMIYPKDRKAESYWTLGLILDGDYSDDVLDTGGEQVMMRYNDDLLEELVQHRRIDLSSSNPPKFEVTHKKDIRKDIGRSPDCSDAVSMLYSEDDLTQLDEFERWWSLTPDQRDERRLHHTEAA